MGEFFSSIPAWQIWAVVGIILCILEIFTPGFYFLALGVGCFLAMFGAFLVGLNGQIAIFVVGSVAFFFISRKVIHSKKSSETFGMDHLVGQDGMAVGDIGSTSGYVKVGGEKWPARPIDNEVISDGTSVHVEGFEGNKLKVKKS